MAIIIFVGPSLSGDLVRSDATFTFRPPAAHGDIYRASLDQPCAIGLIDGYFESVPAVWHKEILFALSRGVHVYGAASMGALRAAELLPFGMVGVGAIFDAYHSGALEDDDEVAVVHGPAELDYAPLSEAMVNVRATIARALADGVLDPEAAATLLRCAKDTFYKERTWAMLLNRVEAKGADFDEEFRLWLSGGAVDQKRRDARLLIDLLRPLALNPPARFRPAFSFEETLDWRAAVLSYEEKSEH